MHYLGNDNHMLSSPGTRELQYYNNNTISQFQNSIRPTKKVSVFVEGCFPLMFFVACWKSNPRLNRNISGKVSTVEKL